MKKLTIIATAALALLSGAAFAQAEGPWMVRARLVNIDSVNKDGTGLGLTINDKVIPEVDITYFLSKNLAVELFCCFSKHHVDLHAPAGFASLSGKVAESMIFPYPELGQAEGDSLHMMLDSVRKYFAANVDSAKIDQEHEIPRRVFDGLRELGFTTAVIAPTYGSR